MIFQIRVTNNVGFGDEINYLHKEFASRSDAEWWCDTHDIDHEYERVSYEVMGEVKS